MIAENPKAPHLNPAVAGGSDLRHPLRAWHTPKWVLSDLQTMADHLKEGDTIAEVGTGAAEFARSLGAAGTIRLTVDLPFQPTSPRALTWPIADDSIDLLISFDALPFASDVSHFVREAARVTRTTKLAVIIARTQDDVKADGLASFFPEAAAEAATLEPEIPVVEKLLAEEGLHCMRRATLTGHRTVDATILSTIAQRGMPGLSALTQDQFDAGVQRLRDAIANNQTD